MVLKIAQLSCWDEIDGSQSAVLVAREANDMSYKVKGNTLAEQ
jgi:hypothetical protein